MCNSLTSNPTQRFTADRARGLEVYYSNQQPYSRQAHRQYNDMGYFTKPAMSFFCCILFGVNISIYF
jgi:hypothetical protein